MSEEDDRFEARQAALKQRLDNMDVGGGLYADLPGEMVYDSIANVASLARDVKTYLEGEIGSPVSLETSMLLYSLAELRASVAYSAEQVSIELEDVLREIFRVRAVR